jgi:hypothetical protein
MKKTFYSALLILFLLAACSPAGTNLPAVPTSTVVVNAPQATLSCTVTPHKYMAQDRPMPVAVVVNAPGVDGLSLVWKDGSPYGSWRTGSPLAVTKLHVATPTSGGVDAAPLIFLNSDESGLHLKLNQTGQISNLIDFPQQVVVTSLIGVPARSTISYSTLRPSPDGKSLRSEIYIGDYTNIASAMPALIVDSAESRYVIPVAIYRKVDGTPDGIWYTYNLYGIGGDSLTDPRTGLYYLDLSTGERLEYLSMGCQFSGLSIGQNWATWFFNGAVHAADLHTGQEITYSLTRADDRAAYASISPAEGYLAWLEGKGWEYDGTLDTILRIATLNGIILEEYPVSAFADVSGLGADVAVVPLGWMAPENENLLVAVYSASTDQSALVYVDVNAQKLTPLVKGIFAGFAYP